jgi:hypothetical protein
MPPMKKDAAKTNALIDIRKNKNMTGKISIIIALATTACYSQAYVNASNACVETKDTNSAECGLIRVADEAGKADSQCKEAWEASKMGLERTRTGTPVEVMGERCTMLGWDYEHGILTEDTARAAVYYAAGCGAGQAGGCMNLARLYDSGIGIEQNPGKAAELRARASLIIGRQSSGVTSTNNGVPGVPTKAQPSTPPAQPNECKLRCRDMSNTSSAYVDCIVAFEAAFCGSQNCEQAAMNCSPSDIEADCVKLHCQ